VQVFARKFLNCSSYQYSQAKITSELQNIQRICSGKHDNIVRVLGHGSFGLDTYTHFIDMELCDLNLEQYIYQGLEWQAHHTLTPKSRFLTTDLTFAQRTIDELQILRQILQGVEYLHSNNKIHRDLHPRNSMRPNIYANSKQSYSPLWTVSGK
jgi:serine/threonine protein kinase